MTTRRITAMAMGAWKWGAPRGHRQRVSIYQAAPDSKGVLRWWHVGYEHSGGMRAWELSRAREQGLRYGSLHRKALTPAEVAAYVEQETREHAI